MPVIIDQLDLVDTQPPPSGEEPAPRDRAHSRPTVNQYAAALRAVASRAARVQAD